MSRFSDVMRKAHQNKDSEKLAKSYQREAIFKEEKFLILVEGSDDETVLSLCIFAKIRSPESFFSEFLNKAPQNSGKDGVTEAFSHINALQQELQNNTRKSELSNRRVIAILDRDNDEITEGPPYYYYDSFDLENYLVRSEAFIELAQESDSEDSNREKYREDRKKIIQLAQILTRYREEILTRNKDAEIERLLRPLYFKLQKSKFDYQQVREAIKRPINQAITRKERQKRKQNQLQNLIFGSSESYVRGKELLSLVKIYIYGGDTHKSAQILEPLGRNFQDDFPQTALGKHLRRDFPSLKFRK